MVLGIHQNPPESTWNFQNFQTHILLFEVLLHFTGIGGGLENTDAAHRSNALLIPDSDVCCSTKWKCAKSKATLSEKGSQDDRSTGGEDGLGGV